MYTSLLAHSCSLQSYFSTYMIKLYIYLSSYLEIESAACELLNVSKFVRPGVVALIGKNCVVVLDFNLWHFDAVSGS